jgi:putative endopeptidase
MAHDDTNRYGTAMLSRTALAVLAVASFAGAGCKDKQTDSPPSPSPPPPPPHGSGSAGSGSAGSGSAVDQPPPLDLAGMDKTVVPGDDFFRYANGTWLATTELPEDRASYGTGAIVAERTDKQNAALLDEATKAPEGSEARKVGDYYAAYLDEAGIEARGAKVLQPRLAAIAAIATTAELATTLGDSVRADVDALNNTNLHTPNALGLWIAQDLTDPTRYLPFLLQGGGEMPDRSYYVDTSDRMKEIRTAYQAHIAAMLGRVGVPAADAKAKAKAILALETRLAKGHAPRETSDDVNRGTNLWARADFAKKAPGLDWEAFFTAAGLAKQDTFVVWHPEAVVALAAAVKAVPLDAWRDYLTFHAIDDAARYLPKAFVDESFAFYATTLAGTPKQRDRWKRGVQYTSEAMGMAVGKLYVAKYFPQAAKDRAAAMVANMITAFGKRIDALEWMTPATKEKAKAKLAVLKVGVGFPDKWPDYSTLVVAADDPLGNAERADRWKLAHDLAKLGTPVDRGEWVMVPQLVDAVNLPAMNAMNFPAAILQPPFFDPNRPEVMDYGAIGAIIGHEISHSFDDSGAQFDATGKLANWWTKEDLAHFQASAKKMVAQYDAYRPFPDLAVNGKQTLSENIADAAGLAVAYDGYKLASAGKPPADWQGLTPDQQFFVSFAQMWRNKAREQALRNRILTDGHSPAEYRADTVRNLDAWYTAFAVKDGEKLALPAKDRVRIW